MLSSFTPVDQSQDCVAENSVNLFQGNIIDDVFPLFFMSHLLLNGWSMRNLLILDSTTHIMFLMNTKLKKRCRDLQHHSQKFQAEICPYLTIMTHK
jgi:hypothetical protein